MSGLRPRLARIIAAAKEPPPSQPPPPPKAVPLTEVSPFETDESRRNQRQEAALSMADPDVYGYLLIMLRRDKDGRGQIEVKASVAEDSWWPAFIRTMRRTIEAVR